VLGVNSYKWKTHLQGSWKGVFGRHSATQNANELSPRCCGKSIGSMRELLGRPLEMLEIPNVVEAQVTQTVWEGGRRTKRTGNADEMQKHRFGHRFCEIQTAQCTSYLTFHIHEGVFGVHVDSIHPCLSVDLCPLLVNSKVCSDARPNLTNACRNFLSLCRLAHHDNHNHTPWLHEDLHDFIPPWQKRQ